MRFPHQPVFWKAFQQATRGAHFVIEFREQSILERHAA
jgi:hypothetical protein